MKPVYLYEVGIKPWEQTISIFDLDIATITVIQSTLNELSAIWLNVMARLTKELPTVLKWRSVGYKTEGSRTQEFTLVSKLRGELGNAGFMGKNPVSGVYSYVTRITDPIAGFDLNSISQPRYAALLLAPGGYTDVHFIWEAFKKGDEGLDAENIKEVVCGLKGSILLRVVESDTHAVAQFIGGVNEVDGVLSIINDLKMEKILEDDVSAFINKKQ